MLYIVATPIGNSEDVTLRALRALGEVDLILAEDTRKTGLILKKWGATNKLVSFYEHNEARKTPGINAGTPTLSDPGYSLVRECRKEGIPVTSLPGPSSITNALALTSLGHEKFAFLGYMPRKPNERKKLLEKVKNWDIAIVFFESPFRLLKSLNDLKQVLGNRRIAIAREMTKKFEEILELNLEQAIKYFENKKPKGEFTIIFR